jgi:mitogen-activated protein kinase kinase
MLLQHAWLAPLVKPATITEEDEDEAEAEAAAASGKDMPAVAAEPESTLESGETVFDKEVADWVKDALEKKRNGTLGKGAPKPALHAAPLDAMGSPGTNGVPAS